MFSPHGICLSIPFALAIFVSKRRDSSGYALEMLAQQCRAPAQSIVLVKPYRNVELAERLRQALTAKIMASCRAAPREAPAGIGKNHPINPRRACSAWIACEMT
jgi:hypothetical protein